VTTDAAAVDLSSSTSVSQAVSTLNTGQLAVDLDTFIATAQTSPLCGNGSRDTGEQCDDGNTTDGDGCSSTCKMDKIVFNTWTNNKKIVVINPNGTGRTDLTDATYNNYAPVWSPDFSQIAFCSKRTGDNYASLYLMNANGANVTKIKEISGEDCDETQWTPDGQKLVLSTYLGLTSPEYKLYIMNKNGSGLLYLANGQSPMMNVDGSKIFFNDRADSMKFKSVKPDGTELTTLVSDYLLYPLEISPNGSRMLFTGFDIPAIKISGGSTEKSGLFFGNSDFSGVYTLLFEDSQEISNFVWYGDWSASWSPAGTRIVYDKITPTEHSIYISNYDGTNPTLLSTDAVAPDWTN
jgi:cysteine-rich repeat protein